MPNTNAINAGTVRQMEAYSQYRDALIQYLFLAKARQYLRQLENLEGTSDRALRKRFEDRFQRLTDRQAKLDDILVGFMNNPLISHRHTRNRTARSGNSHAAGAPVAAEAAAAHANPHGAAPPDSGHSFAAEMGTDDWPFPSCPSTNINGLPMVGNVDIHGNPYGSTAFDSNGF
ncbi:hypothetical protein PQR68_23335 [Paraburkholderia agricolaris]|uniref:hypothetical protein n=1 Tax=Paraburkholderia agricolaris TaxID=2152888 RepID=UPI0038B6F827